MKLTAILMLAAVFQVGARGTAQTVTYSAKSETLTKVFSVIEEQTGYVFFYRKGDVKDLKPVSVNLRNADIKTALAAVLDSQPLNYEIEGNTISISAKEDVSIVQTLEKTAPPPLKGIIRDNDGNALAGVNVVIKGTRKGVTTDGTGAFSIEAGENDVLVISSIGFKATEVKIVSVNVPLIVALQKNVSQLDEVQYIAYGKQTQRLSTSNVVSVKAAEIEKQPVNNPLLALAGRVPGLVITQSKGLPGAGISVRVQGQNSLASGSDPLYVIDGMAYPSQMFKTVTGGPLFILGTSGAGGGQGNPLSYINMDDIENISVLRDAEATAIYGSRAANGAILITTKKARQEQIRFEATVQTGFSKATNLLDMMNTQQYLEMRNEALANDGLEADPTVDYDLALWDTTRYTNWQKELLGRSAPFTRANLRVSGGNALSRYSLGLTFSRESVVYPGDFGDRKIGTYFNIGSTSFNRKFSVQASGQFMADNNELPYRDLTIFAHILAPNAPKLYNLDGSINWEPDVFGFPTWENPTGVLKTRYTNKTKNLLSNIDLGYEIIKGLTIRSVFGYNLLMTNEVTVIPLISQTPIDLTSTSRSAMYSKTNTESFNIEPQLNYVRRFGRSDIDLLLGTSINQRFSDGYAINGSEYNSDDVLGDPSSAANISIYSSGNLKYKYFGVFSRFSYRYDDKYVLNLAARRDGSSNFGDENKYNNFWSIGAGWIFTNETGMVDRFRFLSFGKLRANIGLTGNDQIAPYSYLSLYSPIQGLSTLYQGAIGLEPRGLSNPFLQWEETRKYQGGIDLGFLKDRILFTANYAYNTSSNQLLSMPLPISTGFGSVADNLAATVLNTSWEFVLSVNDMKLSKVHWNSSINVTIPENELKSFDDLEKSTFYSQTYVVGQPVDVRRLTKPIGVNSATGVYEIADADGNPVDFPDPKKDYVILFSTFPKYYGGWQNNFRYNGLELSFLFQFVKQQGAGGFQYGGADVPGVRMVNQPLTVLNRWRKPGDVTNIQVFDSDYRYAQNYYNYLRSSAVIEDASFIRLKNISLSYNFRPKTLSRLHLNNCSFFLLGQNILTITNYSGYDPENKGLLPPMKVFTAGVKIGL